MVQQSITALSLHQRQGEYKRESMTQQNTFIRKFGKLAIIITVTDWEDFAELGQEDKDYIVSSVTTKSIYSNMQPSMQINTYKAIDITEGTKGMGLAGIITEGCDKAGKDNRLDEFVGGLWAYRKCGLSISEQFSRPTITP